MSVNNLTGIAVASVFGLTPEMGLIGGSVSLSGGHGTAIAWAPTFVEQYKIESAMEVGLACATFGLVLGGLIGGPVAEWLIVHHKLEPSGEDETTVGLSHNEETEGKITVEQLLRVVFVICICVGLGTHLSKLCDYFGLQLPEFVHCLFAGIILTNTIPYLFPKIPWQTGAMTLRLVSDYSLGLLVDLIVPCILDTQIPRRGLSSPHLPCLCKINTYMKSKWYTKVLLLTFPDSHDTPDYSRNC